MTSSLPVVVQRFRVRPAMVGRSWVAHVPTTAALRPHIAVGGRATDEARGRGTDQLRHPLATRAYVRPVGCWQGGRPLIRVLAARARSANNGEREPLSQPPPTGRVFPAPPSAHLRPSRRVARVSGWTLLSAQDD